VGKEEEGEVKRNRKCGNRGGRWMVKRNRKCRKRGGRWW